jgi:hypothetical protein
MNERNIVHIVEKMVIACKHLDYLEDLELGERLTYL